MIKIMRKALIFLLLGQSIIGCSKISKITPIEKIEISSGWQFKQADSGEWMPATIPGTVHTDLLANKKIEDPFYRTNEHNQQWIDKKDWIYKTYIEVDSALLQKENIELNFKGLDTYADIYVNDSLILKTDNMFREYEISCKKFLKSGKNILKLYFHSPINEGLKRLQKLGYSLPASNDQSENGGLGDKKVSVFTRKAGYHYGWDWGPRFVTSGVWRPIFLQAWNNAKLKGIHVIQQTISDEKADLKVVFEVQSSITGNANLEIACKNDLNVKGTGKIKLHQGMCSGEVNLTIQNPKLWWTNGLGEAYLYNLKGILKIDNTIIDQSSANIGIRTVKIIQKPDSVGKSFYVELNGKAVFMKGANYIPNDNFLPRVTAAEYEKVVKSAHDTKMNMLRIWGGGIYENDVFYDFCDKYGILLWQDFMFACSMYPGDNAFLENVRLEAIDNVKRLRNHPSLGLWCGNNEMDAAWQEFNEKGGWGWKSQYDTQKRKAIWHSYDTLFHKILPAVVLEFDGDHYYWPSSPSAGWFKHSDFSANSGDIHYWDVWWGQKPFEEYKTHIGRFMSEYGFQSFPEFNTVKTYTIPSDYDIFSEVMKAHQRSSIGNGTIKNYMQRDYKVPADFRKFLYVGQVLQAEGIKYAMEAHRRAKPYCMGSLFWQINDCWPVASWSSTDYYRRWKAQQYFAKKAYSDVLVSPVLDATKLSVYIVNDLQEVKKTTLNLKVIDFLGKVLYEKSIPSELKDNSSASFFSDDLSKMVPASSLKNSLLYAVVKEGDKVLSDNIIYFLPPKNLDLPKSTVKKSLKEENGAFILSLSTDKLVKNLYLSLDEGEGFFSDNYFDILPGQTVEISFKAISKMDLSTFEKHLKMMKLDEI
jgi:beta-mannosidase